MSEPYFNPKLLNSHINIQKFYKIMSEPCAKVLIYAFKHFYAWKNSNWYNIGDNLDEEIFDSRTWVNGFFKRPLETDQLVALKDDQKLSERLNVQTCYKLMRYATANENLKHSNNEVWKEECSFQGYNTAEHCSYRVMYYKNKFKDVDFKKDELTDMDIFSFCNVLLMIIPHIYRETGFFTEVGHELSDDLCATIVKEITGLRDIKEISYELKEEIASRIREQDLEARYLDDLNRMFGLVDRKKGRVLDRYNQDELKGYIPTPFIRRSDGKKFPLKDLFTVGSTQVIIIESEVGVGKTALSRYLCHQGMLKSNVIDGLLSYDFVLYIACRNMKFKNIKDYLGHEFKNALECTPNISSLMQTLERYNILYILDSFENATNEFPAFLKSLLITLPDNHKIIITGQPQSIKTIEKLVDDMTVTEIYLERFNEAHIKKVAQKFLTDTHGKNFVLYYNEKSKDDFKKLLEIPLMLCNCLELWEINESYITDIPLINAQKLVEKKHLLKEIKAVIHRHMDNFRAYNYVDREGERTTDCAALSLEIYKMAAGIMMLNRSEVLTSVNEIVLFQLAMKHHMIGYFTFEYLLDAENYGDQFYYSNYWQIEVYACLYLKKCDEDQLREIITCKEMDHNFAKKNPMTVFDFIFECCDRTEFVHIYGAFLKYRPEVQHPHSMKYIKEKNVDFFNALKHAIESTWQDTLLLLYVDEDYKMLRSVLDDLTTNTPTSKMKINLLLPINKEPIDYKQIIDILTDFKHRYTFRLLLKIEDAQKAIDVISTLKERKLHKLIREVDFHSTYDKNIIKDICSFNLDKISFSIDGEVINYSESCLPHMISFFSTSFQNARQIYFNVRNVHPSKVIYHLIKITKKIKHISPKAILEFNLNSDVDSKYSDASYEKTIEKFNKIDNRLIIEKMTLNLSSCKTDNIWMKLVNYDKFELLVVNMLDNDVEKSKPIMEGLCNMWEFDKYKELKHKRIHFDTKHIDIFNAAYIAVPANIGNRISIKLSIIDVEGHPPLSMDTITEFQGKRMKKIDLITEPPTFLPNEYAIIGHFMDLSKVFEHWEITNSSYPSGICLPLIPTIQNKH